LARANRGEFQTLLSSRDVSGGIENLDRLSHRALLAVVALAGLWSYVALLERGHLVAAGICALAAVVTFGLFIVAILRRS
jgi:hypothetical protein